MAKALQAAVAALLKTERKQYSDSFYYWAGLVAHGFADVKLDEGLLDQIHSYFINRELSPFDSEYEHRKSEMEEGDSALQIEPSHQGENEIYEATESDSLEETTKEEQRGGDEIQNGRFCSDISFAVIPINLVGH